MLEKSQKDFNFDTFPQIKPVNIYFDDVLAKLTAKTTFFKGLAKKIVYDSLQKIREVPAGIVLIAEGDKFCDFFYLLLKGDLGVYEKDTKIAQIDGVQIFGEIGYFNGQRIASVITEEKSYIVKITRDFIESLPPEVQAIFYQNIAQELAKKMQSANMEHSRVLSETSNKARAMSTRTTRRIQEITSNL